MTACFDTMSSGTVGKSLQTLNLAALGVMGQKNRPLVLENYIALRGVLSMKRNIIIAAIVLSAAIASVLIWGTIRNPADNLAQQESDRRPDTAILVTDTGDLDYVFKVFAPDHRIQHLSAPAILLQSSLAEQGIQMEVELLQYGPDEREIWPGLLLSKFAAGLGPDVFSLSSATLHPFIEHGFIADIYDMIDRSTNFSREDFFTNILEGLEINGHLYFLPTRFGVDFIGINANVPAEFLDRFKALDRASTTDITTLYLDLISEYPQWAEFALIHDYNPQQGVWAKLVQSVNFAQRTVNLSHITNLFENIRFAFYGNRRFGTDQFLRMHGVNFQIIQERYVFSRGMFWGALGLLELSEHPFVNYVPLANESGQIGNWSWSQFDMVVNRNANPDFVMDFFANIVNSEFTDAYIIEIAVPILRRYFNEGLETRFRNLFNHPVIPNPPIASNPFDAIHDAITRLEEYSTWPFMAAIMHLIIPMPPLNEIFNEFMDSDMSAQEAISRLEAAIVASLKDAHEIGVFADEETPGLPDLPHRTLTILTNQRNTAAIAQAADAMNRDWRERDKPYVFQVEVDVHGHHTATIGDNAAVAARLRMELMTGHGPDMLMMSPWFFSGGDLDLHGFVGSGFLHDIYKLMDTDPRTSRDDFFNQAISAFEISNGLYQFPLSFGFEYLGINTSLPQEFLDRFTSKTSITFSEMMEFYLDLMEEHYEEFGHLDFGTGGSLT